MGLVRVRGGVLVQVRVHPVMMTELAALRKGQGAGDPH